jgi:tetratricopeptide (TPR) repeat protein
MYLAGASILALIAYIVYLSLQSPSPSPASGSPAGVPPVLSVPSAGGGDHIATLEQAVRDRPGDPDALLALANGLHDHRDWERAIETYQEYLQNNPGNPDARVDMGICYFEISQAKPERGEEYFAKAVGEMETALKKSPKHVPAAFNLGAIYLQRGAVQRSNDWFKRAVAMDKNHPLAQRAQRMLEQHSFSN